jgi:hypothetical protein
MPGAGDGHPGGGRAGADEGGDLRLAEQPGRATDRRRLPGQLGGRTGIRTCVGLPLATDFQCERLAERLTHDGADHMWLAAPEAASDALDRTVASCGGT